MIKLKQITTVYGVTYFIFEYDLGGELYQIEVSERDIIEKLKRVQDLLGRSPKLQDLKEVIVTIVNEVRQGRKPFLERFDYSQFVGVDLETQP